MRELVVEGEKKVEAKEEKLKAKEDELKAQVVELRKARTEVKQLKGELIKCRDAVAEALALKAKPEATEDQARTAATLAVEFLASKKMTQIKGLGYDEGV